MSDARAVTLAGAAEFDPLQPAYAVPAHNSVCFVLSHGCRSQVADPVVQSVMVFVIDDWRNRFAADRSIDSDVQISRTTVHSRSDITSNRPRISAIPVQKLAAGLEHLARTRKPNQVAGINFVAQ